MSILRPVLAWTAAFILAALRQHTSRAHTARRFLLTVGVCAPVVAAATPFGSTPLGAAGAVLAAVLGGRCSLVGLTGGIATGKSTVSARLAGAHGIKIIDADLIARQVVAPGRKAYARIVRRFGAGVLSGGAGSALDREKLGDLIFKDPAQRRALNKIVHPAIALDIARQFLWLRLVKGHRHVVLDAPLLFETGGPMRALCFPAVVVACPGDTQVARLRARNPELSAQQASERIAAQMPLAAKVARADEVVNNGEDGVAALHAKVDALVLKLRAKY